MNSAISSGCQSSLVAPSAHAWGEGGGARGDMMGRKICWELLLSQGKRLENMVEKEPHRR
jgi:hypothetical protein